MAKKFEVDVTPEMRLYKILQRQAYGINTALAEFVDNAVQSFIDKRHAITAREGKDTRLSIMIIVDSDKKTITIEDNAGGINKANFQRAIRMGTPENHKQDSLSVYGIGMKSAAIWLTDTWQIETSALGSKEKLITKFDLDELLKTGEGKIPVITTSENPTSHYTRIVITNTLRNESELYYKDTVLPYLKESFLRFKFLDIKISFNGIIQHPPKKIFITSPEPLFCPPVNKDGTPTKDAPISWKKDIDIDFGQHKVTGFIMIMKTGSYFQPGIRLLRNQRVIEGTSVSPNIPEEILGTKNKYAAQRIYGELNLNGYPVNFMKTAFDGNLEPLYRLISQELIGDRSSPNFVAQATNYRARAINKPPPPTPAPAPKPTPTPAPAPTPTPAPTPSPPSPKIHEEIQYSEKLDKAFGALENNKLQNLYSSICKLSLKEHPIIAYLSVWTLFEVLARKLGAPDNQSFDAYFNSCMNKHEILKNQKKTFQNRIKDIADKGNMMKHDSTWHAVDATQLAVDMMELEEFLCACIESSKTSQKL
ncbi:MAG: ATP-binding protein [Parvibaculales bacterium]